MKRMHLHISVNDLSRSIAFYNALFGAEPTVMKADYAKWMLDNPMVNFAISQRGAKVGLDHIGIQASNDKELTDIKARLDAADIATQSQESTSCCYSTSDKHWVQDPAGIAWESYHTLASIPTFNAVEVSTTNSACCTPSLTQSKSQPVQIISRKGKTEHDKPSNRC